MPIYTPGIEPVGYSLRMSRRAGEDTPIPAVVTEFQITGRSTDSFTLTWAIPSSDPGPIPDGWRVQIQSAGGDWSSPLIDSVETAPDVALGSGVLSADSAHDLRITALSGAKNSDWAELLAEYTPPFPPASFETYGTGEGSMDVSWSGPENVQIALYFNRDDRFETAFLTDIVPYANFIYHGDGLAASTQYFWWAKSISDASGLESNLSAANGFTL